MVLSAPRRSAFFLDDVRILLWCDRGFSDFKRKLDLSRLRSCTLLKRCASFISRQDLKDSTKPSYKNAWIDGAGGGGG